MESFQKRSMSSNLLVYSSTIRVTEIRTSLLGWIPSTVGQEGQSPEDDSMGNSQIRLSREDASTHILNYHKSSFNPTKSVSFAFRICILKPTQCLSCAEALRSSAIASASLNCESRS